MDFSVKQAMGVIIALVCVALLIVTASTNETK